MITPFDKTIEAVKSAQSSTDELIIDQVRQEEAFAIQLQADQMFDGRRGDGQQILPRYTQATVRIKRRRGQPTDRVTLRDTGDFHDSIVIDYGSDSFQYDATDEKRARLTRKYGNGIFGLDDQSLSDLIGRVREPIIREMQKRILINA